MELTALNITQAADMLAKKEISSAELTQAYIDRIERMEPEVNALVTTCADEALEAAKRVDKKRVKAASAACWNSCNHQG